MARSARAEDVLRLLAACRAASAGPRAPWFSGREVRDRDPGLVVPTFPLLEDLVAEGLLVRASREQVAALCPTTAPFLYRLPEGAN